jgi:hypothetical protein
MISGVVKINVSRRPIDQSEREYGARKIVLAQDALTPSGRTPGSAYPKCQTASSLCFVRVYNLVGVPTVEAECPEESFSQKNLGEESEHRAVE